MKLARVFLPLSILAAGAFAAGYWYRAVAAGVPAKNALTYSGVATDGAGAPLTGNKGITLQLFDAATAGTMKCTVGPTTVTLGPGGEFQLPLTDDCAAAVHASPDLWVEVFVGGESAGRSKLGAVPYALEADQAAAASTAANGGPLATQLASLTSRITTLETALAAQPKTASGFRSFEGGKCTLAAPCDVDLSAAKFTQAPSCVITMANIDGTGYTENMVVKSLTATTLSVWKGQYYTMGTTMQFFYLCSGK